MAARPASTAATASAADQLRSPPSTRRPPIHRSAAEACPVSAAGTDRWSRLRMRASRHRPSCFRQTWTKRASVLVDAPRSSRLPDRGRTKPRTQSSLQKAGAAFSLQTSGRVPLAFQYFMSPSRSVSASNSGASSAPRISGYQKIDAPE